MASGLASQFSFVWMSELAGRSAVRHPNPQAPSALLLLSSLGWGPHLPDAGRLTVLTVIPC